MEGDAVLVAYCLAADFDATTGTCAAPFYGPPTSALPVLSYADGVVISGVIIGAWAIGFMIRQGRNAIPRW